MSEFNFPSEFIWGAASASYQLEGAAYEDGKGLSVWDVFCKKPGSVWGGNTGDISCNHYHLFETDVRLMRELGLKGYRFSISWPRVLPEGVGSVNRKGAAFYDRLVDILLGAGIQPYVTLFHWDYPYSLFLKGGWLNPDSGKWFAEYTEVMVELLSDRVKHWMTLNEPQVFLELGHRVGNHAPGMKYNLSELLLAAHHVLLAHGLSVQVIRAGAKAKPIIGYAPVANAYVPASESEQDIQAARRATYEIKSANLWSNTWFSDPMFFQSYPEDGLKLFAGDMPKITSTDLEIIAQPLDFYGYNNYTSTIVKAGENGQPIVVSPPDGSPMTAVTWRVIPEGLYWVSRFLWERYQKPIIVTENGMTNYDWVALDGGVHDPQRIDFTKRYLRQLHRAIKEGVPVAGYFHWSIMDNFEWAQGYKERFGLIYVDYVSQKRILKDSALWYKDVISSKGAALDA